MDTESNTENHRCIWREMIISLAAGGPINILEILVAQPLDTVKTRCQAKLPWKEDSSGIACARKIYKTEHMLSFWKGLTPALIIDAPRRSFKFVTYRHLEKLFTPTHLVPDTTSFALAGLVSGSLEALFANPFHVVKVAQQLNPSYITKTPTSLEITRQIYNTEGIKGFFQGSQVSVCRGGLVNMLYFGCYKTFVHMNSSENPLDELIRQAKIAFFTGALVSFVMYPIDLVKTRMLQTNYEEGACCFEQFRRFSITDMFGHVFRTEGIKGLYRGVISRIIRVAPATMVLTLAFTNFTEHVEDTYIHMIHG